jgi:hypothetical protein
MITSWPTYYTDMHVLVTQFLIYSLVLGPRLQSWTFDLLVKLFASTAVHIFSSLLPHTNWHHSDPKEAQSNTVIKCLREALLQVSQLHHILLQDQHENIKDRREKSGGNWNCQASSPATYAVSKCAVTIPTQTLEEPQCLLAWPAMLCPKWNCHHPNTNS